MRASAAIHETLSERFRRMDRCERAVLMRASAIGHGFSLALLNATVAYSESRVRSALDRLCHVGLIAPDDSTGRSYAFRHGLIRDAAYHELMSESARPVHRRITRALERLAAEGADVPLHELAYHAWLSRDRRRCQEYNELAGDRAAAMFATADARTHYERARSRVRATSGAHVRLTRKLAAMGDAGA